MNAFKTEQEQVDLLVPWLEDRGFKTECEVPQMSQIVDVACVRRGLIYLIEAKLTNWKRAMEQCEAHTLVADYIYIAIGNRYPSVAFFKAMMDKGWGIIHCNPKDGLIHIALEAKKNKEYLIPQKKVFFEKFKARFKI